MIVPVMNSRGEKLPGLRFLLNDYDPHVFARNLLIWHLLDQLIEGFGNKEGTEMLYTTIYYIFCAPAMPAEVFQRLQHTIVECIEMLQNEDSLPGWLSITEAARPAIISALKTWQTEVPALYTVSNFHESLMRATADSSVNIYRHQDDALTTAMQMERDCYDKTLLLQPDDTLLQKDSRLRQLYDAYRKDQTKTKELKDYVADTWSVNPTLFNLEDEKRQENITYLYPEPWRQPKNMYYAAMAPAPTSSKSLRQFVEPFFETVAMSLKLLSSMMTVQVTSGDVAHSSSRFVTTMNNARRTVFGHSCLTASISAIYRTISV